ncbi:MAG: hypothetical protein OEW58_12320 [Gammaproteobacteria bacterium]|nr:hypothetical protein [Gammaproteobacteria bacterium]
MKIQSSQVQLSARHEHSQTHEVRENLRLWRTETTTAPDTVAISDRAKELQQKDESEKLNPVRVKYQSLIRFVEALTGKKMKFIDPTSETTESSARSSSVGMSYERTETYQEQESVQFTAAAIIKTADGKQITVDLELNMSRSLVETTGIRLDMGNARQKDPLVINFDGNSAGLTDAKFRFDIDADGEADQISRLREGSGYLALDANADGVINHGRELFGAISGDGFADLGKYDQDRNLWIDENDDIYHKLRIWTQDENGNDQLMALGEKNIGAIFLGKVSSPFQLRDASQTVTHGEIASTGIYLNEDGTAGTVQQIFVAV